MSEYIEFEINDPARFQMLQEAFQKIKTDKDRNSFEDENVYLRFFDEKAKYYFGWYSEKENKEWSEKWFSTPLENRWTNPNLERKWIFGSMIEMFKDGEYELLSCEKVSDKIGRLCYKPFSFPYGGTGCMKALIESFGFEIVEVSDE